ncbi:MAG: hypothetical protein HC769_19670 [Cyanobacteria bacterium CRU_2_1]|nr:hypothetical protein [Cyanobacteria bacterium RU_5_0]NJR60844.1 hypothetical protein [Cyanobacteria bacterium CRU_2_1]
MDTLARCTGEQRFAPMGNAMCNFMATSLDFWWGRQDAYPDRDGRDAHPTRDVTKLHMTLV